MMKWFLFFKELFFGSKKADSVEPVKDPIENAGEVRVLSGTVPKQEEIFPDISRYRKCDFTKFTGHHLVTKATESDNYVDPTFKFNAEECKKSGVHFYVYHFYRCEVDPIKQANHFLKAISGYDVYTPLIVDYESAYKQDHESLEKNLDNLKLFIRHVNDATDSKMIIYTGEYLLNKLSFDQEFVEICGNPWVANYSKKPVKFGPWKTMWAWQFTDSYKKFDGINHKDGADGNKFYN